MYSFNNKKIYIGVVKSIFPLHDLKELKILSELWIPELRNFRFKQPIDRIKE